MANIANSMSFGGQSVSATDKRGLFLKVFSGEVMKAYERAIKVAPLLTSRTISSGKSAQFPTTGTALARFFEPGDNLLEAGAAAGQSADNSHEYLSKIKQSERIIYIDELLTSSCFIDDLDEAMSHYDYRSIFAKELGNALARHQDNYAVYQLFQATQDAGNVNNETTPGAANDFLTSNNFYTDGAAALDTLYDAARVLDLQDVPKEDRFVVLNPYGYYSLLKSGVFTVDSTAGGSDARMIFDGGGNDYVGGRMTTVAGMPVVVTNADGFCTTANNDGRFLADTKGGESADEPEDAGSRNIAASLGSTGQDVTTKNNMMALVFHRSAVGEVKLKDVTMESEYIIERQGTLMVAKLATGMGVLRPDAVVGVQQAT